MGGHDTQNHRRIRPINVSLVRSDRQGSMKPVSKRVYLEDYHHACHLLQILLGRALECETQCLKETENNLDQTPNFLLDEDYRMVKDVEGRDVTSINLVFKDIIQKEDDSFNRSDHDGRPCKRERSATFSTSTIRSCPRKSLDLRKKSDGLQEQYRGSKG